MSHNTLPSMNLQEILDQKIRRLPAGPHLDGLRAVKSHIDAGVRHLVRGQKEPDETLFTDVIFRCNQAFEGSIKEAYRVLAGKDPQRTTPAEIEKFLTSANLLRKKVLDQFTTYRREWRNPSTHDYTLDFDEDEALWPAPGSEDTELGVLMELEVGHGETEVYPRVQA
jgi:hypothetical protein